MKKRKIRILHLYANEMNIYGDRGNVIALMKRLHWRGYEAEVVVAGIGQDCDYAAVDVLFAGGGQDRGQVEVGRDLQNRAEALRKLRDDGVPMLTVCGTYQLFGHYFRTLDGVNIPGIGIFDAHTEGSNKRMIGNIVVDSRWGRLVGFENHSGQTVLLEGQEGIGSVTKGYGNNDRSGVEGAISMSALGTYLHGPVLPKNPMLADFMILSALRRKFGVESLPNLEDDMEFRASEVAASRPQ